MANTALIHHPDFPLHEVGASHPERPSRIIELLKTIRQSHVAERVIWKEAQEVDPQILELNHTEQHIAWTSSLAQLTGPTAVSPDTVACAQTPRLARLGAGSAVLGADLVMRQVADNAFCAVRPPGHHAEADRAMGFCFYNNVALAARFLRHRHGLERIAIIDWDVHHGNGTQHSFYDDPSVFFFSIHQYPHYPGTGAAEEMGQGQGMGCTLNVPVEAGSTDDDYLKHFKRSLVPALRSYQPQFILLSAGFDAHARDPLGGVCLSAQGFSALSDIVLEIAAEHCGGKLVSVLEGGYDLEALSTAALAHVQALVAA